MVHHADEEQLKGAGHTTRAKVVLPTISSMCWIDEWVLYVQRTARDQHELVVNVTGAMRSSSVTEDSCCESEARARGERPRSGEVH